MHPRIRKPYSVRLPAGGHSHFYPSLNQPCDKTIQKGFWGPCYANDEELEERLVHTQSGDSSELAPRLPCKGKSLRNRGVSQIMPFLVIPRSLLRGGFILDSDKSLILRRFNKLLKCSSWNLDRDH